MICKVTCQLQINGAVEYHRFQVEFFALPVVMPRHRVLLWFAGEDIGSQSSTIHPAKAQVHLIQSMVDFV